MRQPSIDDLAAEIHAMRALAGALRASTSLTALQRSLDQILIDLDEIPRAFTEAGQLDQALEVPRDDLRTVQARMAAAAIRPVSAVALAAPPAIMQAARPAIAPDAAASASIKRGDVVLKADHSGETFSVLHLPHGGGVDVLGARLAPRLARALACLHSTGVNTVFEVTSSMPGGRPLNCYEQMAAHLAAAT